MAYCLHPIELKRKSKDGVKYSEDGVKDESSARLRVFNNHMLVPCGKCIACLNRQRKEKTYRLKQESLHSDYSLFVTLTYDDEHLPMKSYLDDDGVQHVYCGFDKKHLQDYFKLVRYHLSNLDSKITFRYFLVSEYGHQTFRSHYHYIAFLNYVRPVQTTAVKEILLACWKHGQNNVVKEANDANIHYVTKYVLKDIGNEWSFDSNRHAVANGYNIDYSLVAGKFLERCFTLCSKRPYIGYQAEPYLSANASQTAVDLVMQTSHQVDKSTGEVRSFTSPSYDNSGVSSYDGTIYSDGYRQAMPRIYRQKIGVGTSFTRSDSPDPRLSKSLYDAYAKEFKQIKPLGTYAEFQTYVQIRLNNFERTSIKNSSKRNEKL